MPGMGPAPKPGSARSARRKAMGQGSVLSREVEVDKPSLPNVRYWSEMTLAWWDDVWASPMAQEFDASDIHGLVALAALVDDFWTAETPRQRQMASQEIRLQGVRFGLSPIDRRRLQWEIEKTDEAQARGTKRRRSAEEVSSPPADQTGAKDPRAVLRAL